MAFKFAARALLELGKELISSDEVALYELIKNSVDAKSPTIEIDINVVITFHVYSSTMDEIGDGLQKTDVLARLRSKIDTTASAASINAFFAEFDEVGGSKTALQAALKSAYEKNNWIEVMDIGHGMSLAELSEVFLTVGTRSRRAQNVAGSEFLGDKGVGRLSTMRLGEKLLVTTTRENDEFYSNLAIDWNQFSHDSLKDVSEIEVAPHRGARKRNRKVHGTTIRVSELSGDWSETRFQEMLEGKIARMVDPFEKGKGNRLLTARYNHKHLLIPSIPEKLLAAAHATCKAEFKFDNRKEPIIKGLMQYRLRNASREIHQVGTEVLSIAQKVSSRRGKKGHAAKSITPIRLKVLKDLGSFEVEIYWFNRLVVEAVEGLTDKRTETREQISKWSGGPMLFRRGFRILPYGEPGDDWLELDKNAFGVSGFKLNRQQVIGRVRVTAGHGTLSEQTNREGLVRSDAGDALRIILMWLLHHEFRNLINEADDTHQLKVQKDKLAQINLDGTNAAIQKSFSALRAVVGKDALPHVDQLTGLVEKLESTCQTVIEVSAAQQARSSTERDKFVQLAGIGLMTEFIFHELDRAVQHTLRLLTDKKGSQQINLAALEEQLITLQKRVSAFDEFTGERRQTKTTFDVREVVNLVADNHANQFSRHGIHLSLIMKEPLRVRAVKGMLVQILENLVSNAVYWIKAQKEIESNYVPQLTIKLEPATRTLTVADNGPGVDPSRKDIIFQPFISSKPPGEGRGLGLYISKDLAEYHGWDLEMDNRVDLIRPGRLNAFVLDMDEKS